MNIFTKRNKVNVLILIICNAIFVNVNAQEVSCWYTKSSGTISLWNARNNPGPGTYEVNIVEKNDLRNNISVTTNGAIINVGSNYATHDQNFTCALSNSGTSGSSNSDNSTNEIGCWYTKSSGTISLWNARNNPGPGTYEVNIVEKNDLRNNISISTNGAIINVGSNYAIHDQNFTCALSSSGTSGSSNSGNSTNEIGCWYTKSSGTISLWNARNNPGPGTYGVNIVEKNDLHNNISVTTNGAIINVGSNYATHDQNFTCALSSSGTSGSSNSGNSTNEIGCWYTKSSGTISLWNARSNPGTYDVNIVEKNDLRNNISVTSNGAIINVGSNYATHDQNFTCALSSSGTSGGSNSNISVLKDYPTPAESACGLYIGVATYLDFTFTGAAEKSEFVNKTVNDFNMIVPENGLKWSTASQDQNHFIRQSRGGVNQYAGARQSLDAYSQISKFRGHTLIWHDGSSFHNYLHQLNNADLENELRDYVNDVIIDMNNLYPGKFESWDVVNEALSNDGLGFRGIGDDPECHWMRLGDSNITFDGRAIPQYVKAAFEAAANALGNNTDQALIYNDWGAELANTPIGIQKANAQFNMIKALKNNGIRVDGVGFECHFRLDEITVQSIESFRQNIMRYVNEFGPGFKLYFTEVDIGLPFPSNESTNERLRRQAEQYKMLMELALEIEQVKAFVVWGLSDKYSWLNNPNSIPDNNFHFKDGNLFDRNVNKKNSYDSVLQALQEATCSANRIAKESEVKSKFIAYSEFVAYPNPFNKTLKINLEEGNGQMKIYNINGRTILQKELNSKQSQINTEGLKTGYYIVEVESKGEIQRQKIIKH